MAAAAQAAQHGRGFGGIGRLAEHDVVEHDNGIGAQHRLLRETLRYSQSFLARQALHQLARRLARPGRFVDVGRGHVKINAEPRQEFLASG